MSSLCLSNPAIESGKSEAPSDDLWIARVGRYTIPLDKFVQRYTDFIISNGINDNLAARKAILDNMINEELLLRFDDPSELNGSEAFLNDVESARKRVLLAYLRENDIYAEITVNDSEIRQVFARANERLAARHLYARTEEEANELHELLKIGVDFDFLAKQIFTDSTLHANGGYLGYFSWGDMDPAFEEAAYALDVGQISKPVKTQHGYSIIRLEDRVSHPLITEYEFLQRKPHLEDVLRIRKRKQAEERYLEEVLKRQRVIFHDASLTALLSRLNGLSPRNVETLRSREFSAVCATYEGGAYTLHDIWMRLNELPANQRRQITSMEMLKAAIRGFLVQEQLLAIAREKGYDTLPIVTEKTRKTRDVLFLQHRMRAIAESASFSDLVLRSYYESNLHLFSSEAELNVQEIIVKEKSTADSLREALLNGVDFGVLAKRHSLRRRTAGNGGSTGYAPAWRFGHLSEILGSTGVGELAGPVAVENYFCLFKVLGKRQGHPRRFETVRDEVKRMVQLEMQKTTVGRYLENLRKSVHVQIDERRLRSFILSGFASGELPSTTKNLNSSPRKGKSQ